MAKSRKKIRIIDFTGRALNIDEIKDVDFSEVDFDSLEVNLFGEHSYTSSDGLLVVKFSSDQIDAMKQYQLETYGAIYKSNKSNVSGFSFNSAFFREDIPVAREDLEDLAGASVEATPVEASPLSSTLPLNNTDNNTDTAKKGRVSRTRRSSKGKESLEEVRQRYFDLVSERKDLDFNLPDGAVYYLDNTKTSSKDKGFPLFVDDSGVVRLSALGIGLPDYNLYPVNLPKREVECEKMLSEFRVRGTDRKDEMVKLLDISEIFSARNLDRSKLFLDKLSKLSDRRKKFEEREQEVAEALEEDIFDDKDFLNTNNENENDENEEESLNTYSKYDFYRDPSSGNIFAFAENSDDEPIALPDFFYTAEIVQNEIKLNNYFYDLELNKDLIEVYDNNYEKNKDNEGLEKALSYDPYDNAKKRCEKKIKSLKQSINKNRNFTPKPVKSNLLLRQVLLLNEFLTFRDKYVSFVSEIERIRNSELEVELSSDDVSRFEFLQRELNEFYNQRLKPALTLFNKDKVVFSNFKMNTTIRNSNVIDLLRLVDPDNLSLYTSLEVSLHEVEVFGKHKNKNGLERDTFLGKLTTGADLNFYMRDRCWEVEPKRKQELKEAFGNMRLRFNSINLDYLVKVTELPRQRVIDELLELKYMIKVPGSPDPDGLSSGYDFWDVALSGNIYKKLDSCEAELLRLRENEAELNSYLSNESISIEEKSSKEVELANIRESIAEWTSWFELLNENLPEQATSFDDIIVDITFGDKLVPSHFYAKFLNNIFHNILSDNNLYVNNYNSVREKLKDFLSITSNKLSGKDLSTLTEQEISLFKISPSIDEYTSMWNINFTFSEKDINKLLKELVRTERENNANNNNNDKSINKFLNIITIKRGIRMKPTKLNAAPVDILEYELTDRNDKEYKFSTFSHCDFLSDVLNGSNPKFTFTINEDIGDGKTRKITGTDIIALEDFNAKRQLIQFEFMSFLNSLSDKDKAFLLDKYNRRYNSYVEIEPKHSIDYLTDPNLNRLHRLQDFQARCVHKLLKYEGGAAFCAVGTGKTTMLNMAANLMVKHQGKKILTICKKANIAQFAENYMQMFPDRAHRILFPSKIDFEKDNRTNLLVKMAIQDWDVIFLTQEQFKELSISGDLDKLGFTYEEKIKEYNIQINNIYNKYEDDKLETEKMKKKISDLHIKIIKAELDRDIEKIKSLHATKNGVPFFDELGINHLMVDESHEFKKIEYVTNIFKDGVKGLPGSTGSARARHLFNAVRTLQKKNNPKNEGYYIDDQTPLDYQVTFASGTPLDNSIGELYFIMNYLNPNFLSDLGLDSFDEFMKTFAEVRTESEVDIDGTMKSVSRIRNILKVDTLKRYFNDLYFVFGDSDLNRENKRLNRENNLNRETNSFFDKPEAIRYNVISERNAYHSDFVNSSIVTLSGRTYAMGPWYKKEAEEMFNSRNKPGVLKLGILSQLIKGSLDMRMLRPELPYDPNGKLTKCVENALALHRAYNIEGLPSDKVVTQVIFVDRFDGNSLIKDLDKDGTDDYDRDEEIEEIEVSDTNAKDKKDKTEKAKTEEEAVVVEKVVEEVIEDENQEQEQKILVPPFNTVSELKRLLIEGGVAPNKIAFVNDYKSERALKELYDKVNNGEILFLIGSMQKLGTGVNIQKRLGALHFLTTPFTPALVTQSEGRAVRMGNEFAKENGNQVFLFKYHTKDTSDTFMHQLVTVKDNLVKTFTSYYDNGGVKKKLEDKDQSELLKNMSGNPYMSDFYRLNRELLSIRTRLSVLEGGLINSNSNLNLKRTNFEKWSKQKNALKAEAYEYLRVEKQVFESLNENQQKVRTTKIKYSGEALSIKFLPEGMMLNKIGREVKWFDGEKKVRYNNIDSVFLPNYFHFDNREEDGRIGRIKSCDNFYDDDFFRKNAPFFDLKDPNPHPRFACFNGGRSDLKVSYESINKILWNGLYDGLQDVLSKASQDGLIATCDLNSNPNNPDISLEAVGIVLKRLFSFINKYDLTDSENIVSKVDDNISREIFVEDMKEIGLEPSIASFLKYSTIGYNCYRYKVFNLSTPTCTLGSLGGFLIQAKLKAHYVEKNDTGSWKLVVDDLVLLNQEVNNDPSKHNFYGIESEQFPTESDISVAMAYKYNIENAGFSFHSVRDLKKNMNEFKGVPNDFSKIKALELGKLLYSSVQKVNQYSREKLNNINNLPNDIANLEAEIEKAKVNIEDLRVELKNKEQEFENTRISFNEFEQKQDSDMSSFIGEIGKFNDADARVANLLQNHPVIEKLPETEADKEIRLAINSYAQQFHNNIGLNSKTEAFEEAEIISEVLHKEQEQEQTQNLVVEKEKDKSKKAVVNINF